MVLAMPFLWWCWLVYVSFFIVCVKMVHSSVDGVGREGWLVGPLNDQHFLANAFKLDKEDEQATLIRRSVLCKSRFSSRSHSLFHSCYNIYAYDGLSAKLKMFSIERKLVNWCVSIFVEPPWEYVWHAIKAKIIPMNYRFWKFFNGKTPMLTHFQSFNRSATHWLWWRNGNEQMVCRTLAPPVISEWTVIDFDFTAREGEANAALTHQKFLH